MEKSNLNALESQTRLLDTDSVIRKKRHVPQERGAVSCCNLAAAVLLDRNRVLLRSNPVGDDLQVAGAGFHVGGYVNMGVGGARIANRHGVVIVGAAIENVPRGSCW